MSMIDYKKELNAEQLEVVLGGDGACLVLAGAGTGKTRTIVYRVAFLLEQGIPPAQILLMTFTNKSAKEMLGRVERLLGSKTAGIRGGTFHHMGNWLLRRFGSSVGIDPSFTIADEDDAGRLFQAVCAESGLAGPASAGAHFPKPSVAYRWWSYARNNMQTFETILKERAPHLDDAAMSGFVAAIERYERRKREARLLDFDDLLVFWRRVLEESPRAREMLSGQFRYILVDEYQDTNRLQGDIVARMGSVHGNILVVGDDAQSIYGFRAACVENILKFPEIFPGAKVFRLEENYRSTQAILNLANASIAYNSRQFSKELRGRVPGGEKPAVYGFLDAREEARFLASRIMDSVEEGDDLREHAVLFRAAFQAMQLELELQKRGVPYIIRGGVRFFEQAHIKDVVAYLKLLGNPHDEISWKRVLKMEAGVGDKSAEIITDALRGARDEAFCLPQGMLGVSVAAAQGSSRVLGRLRTMKAMVRAGEMIQFLLHDFYDEYARETFEEARDRIEDIEQLTLFSGDYENLEAFLADVTLSEGFKGDRGADDTARDVLILSTIHQAKGLEWKKVYVLGLAEGQFPHYKSWAEAGEIDEERRLFYVAVTRAKTELTLTYPVTARGGAMGETVMRASTFLSELPSELIESHENPNRIIEMGD